MKHRQARRREMEPRGSFLQPRPSVTSSGLHATIWLSRGNGQETEDYQARALRLEEQRSPQNRSCAFGWERPFDTNLEYARAGVATQESTCPSVRDAMTRPASQPGARRPDGGPISGVQIPARARSHDTSEFEFHISPPRSSSRPHVQMGNAGTSSRILDASLERLLTLTGPFTAAAMSGIVPPRQQRTS
jgi:hypothetical protein